MQSEISTIITLAQWVPKDSALLLAVKRGQAADIFFYQRDVFCTDVTYEEESEVGSIGHSFAPQLKDAPVIHLGEVFGPGASKRRSTSIECATNAVCIDCC